MPSLEKTRRLYVGEPMAVDQVITLNAEASHYLARVLRLRSGQSLELFNGDGNHYGAELLNPDKSAATLKIVSTRAALRHTHRLHLGLALLKGDRLDYALQKATELDVEQVYLINTRRSELKLSEKRLQNRLSHWQRIMHSASEQSGRATVPTLNPPAGLEHTLNTTKNMQRYFLQPGADQGDFVLEQEDLCLFTGPEGGFDPAEQQLLSEHCQGLGLGELILRAETAPVVGLALASAARRKAL